MSCQSVRKEQARTIITVACQMLDHSRRAGPARAAAALNLGDDCMVLLNDATRSFCQAVSEHLGERGTSRWTSVLPKFFYEHPEKCGEILAQLESKDFRGISGLHCLTA